MRRISTDEEMRIIRRNYKKLCTGFAGKMANSKFWDIILIAIFWGIAVIASVEILNLNIGSFLHCLC